MVMVVDNDFYIDRAALSTVFKDPRTLSAFESALQVVQATPASIDQAQTAADGAQASADQAALDAAAADAAAAAAQGGVLALNGAPYVVFTPSAPLSAERVLGGTGVTLDLSTPGLVNLVIAVATILGFTPANKAGDTIGPSTFSGAVDVQGEVRADTLRIDAAPAASATAASHALPINLNGTTYYLKLSATP